VTTSLEKQALFDWLFSQPDPELVDDYVSTILNRGGGKGSYEGYLRYVWPTEEPTLKKEEYINQLKEIFREIPPKAVKLDDASGDFEISLLPPEEVLPQQQYLKAYLLLKPMVKTSMTMDPTIQEVVGNAQNLEELLQRLVDHYRRQAVQYTFEPGESEYADYEEIEDAIEARKNLKAVATALEILQSEEVEEELEALPKVAATREP
jgi:hypothetical protein